MAVHEQWRLTSARFRALAGGCGRLSVSQLILTCARSAHAWAAGSVATQVSHYGRSPPRVPAAADGSVATHTAAHERGTTRSRESPDGPRTLRALLFSDLTMKRSTQRSRAKLVRDIQVVATVAPVVAARRVREMVVKGASGKAQATTLARLCAEKASVAAASSSAMMFATAAIGMRTAFALASAWSPWGGTGRQRLLRVQSALDDASVRIAASGVAPIRRKVAANARRRR